MRLFPALLATTLAAAPLAAQSLPPGLPAGTWEIDPSHASVVFSVNHLGFSDYTASFDRVTATLTLDPADPATAQLDAQIIMVSLDLPAPPDGFLAEMLGPQWFDAATYPLFSFTSDSITLTSDTTADIAGRASWRGKSVPLTLQARFNGGIAPGQIEPHARIGFSASGALSRSAFGMGIGVPAPGSTFGVGDEVRFVIEAEFTSVAD